MSVFHDSPLAGWLPVALNPFEGRLQALRVDDPATLDLDLPFYHHTIEAWQSDRAGEERTFNRDELLAVPGRSPCGMVFHASRCGSTLIAQALAALPGRTVIGEAQPINASLHVRNQRGERGRMGAAILAAMCQWRPDDDVFIKQTSVNVIRGARHIADFPGANWVFVYREPVEIMVSLADSEAGWTRARHDPEGAARLLRVEEDLSAIEVEDYFALGIERMFRAALEFGPDKGLFIDYADLDREGVVAAVEHLGGEAVTEDGRALIEASMRVYSKDRTRTRAHVDDSGAKQAAATPAMRRAAERCADSLRELRLRSWTRER